MTTARNTERNDMVWPPGEGCLPGACVYTRNRTVGKL